jgi:hypothetical protein
VVLRNGKVGVEQLNKREIFNFDWHCKTSHDFDAG